MLAAAMESLQVEVYPENWAAFSLFARLSTQWRVGMNGPTGLDYLVVLNLMDRMRLNDDEHSLMLDDIGVLERAALKAMRDTS